MKQSTTSTRCINYTYNQHYINSKFKALLEIILFQVFFLELTLLSLLISSTKHETHNTLHIQQSDSLILQITTIFEQKATQRPCKLECARQDMHILYNSFIPIVYQKNLQDIVQQTATTTTSHKAT